MGSALRMGLDEGVPVTGVQSFQEPGPRDRNLSFLSPLPLRVNQIPPRPESLVTHSWPPATPLNMTAEFQDWGNGPIQGLGQGRGLGQCFLNASRTTASEALSAGTFKGLGHVHSSAEAPVVFSSGTSNSTREKVTETQRALELRGGSGLFGPIIASLCQSVCPLGIGREVPELIQLNSSVCSYSLGLRS